MVPFVGVLGQTGFDLGEAVTAELLETGDVAGAHAVDTDHVDTDGFPRPVAPDSDASRAGAK